MVAPHPQPAASLSVRLHSPPALAFPRRLPFHPPLSSLSSLSSPHPSSVRRGSLSFSSILLLHLLRPPFSGSRRVAASVGLHKLVVLPPLLLLSPPLLVPMREKIRSECESVSHSHSLRLINQTAFLKLPKMAGLFSFSLHSSLSRAVQRSLNAILASCLRLASRRVLDGYPSIQNDNPTTNVKMQASVVISRS